VLRSEAARRRHTESAEIRQLIEPFLREVADGIDSAAGGVIDGDSSTRRAEARVLESDLRDLLRGRRLAREPLLRAAHDARERGIDVVLLDDLPEDTSDLDAVRHGVTWAAEQLEGTVETPVTVRLARSLTGRAVITFVAGPESDSFTSREL
jgi:hypothetical protein